MSDLNVEAVFDSMKKEREEEISERRDETAFVKKAEILLSEIEEGNLTKEKKYENIIDIVYQISNACGWKLGENNPILDKYATLHARIPIEIMRTPSSPLLYNFLEKKVQYVKADELKVAKTWMGLDEAKENPVKKVYLDYIFELVYISLKKIFEEVKTEIMGE